MYKLQLKLVATLIEGRKVTPQPRIVTGLKSPCMLCVWCVCFVCQIIESSMRRRRCTIQYDDYRRIIKIRNWVVILFVYVLGILFVRLCDDDGINMVPVRLYRGAPCILTDILS